MAPSASGMQNLLDICHRYSVETELVFNPKKSVCMIFKPPKCKLSCPPVYLNNAELPPASLTKYLGCMIHESGKDDEEIMRQMRLLYARANYFLRVFHNCSMHVKLNLFQSHCATFYCPYLWTRFAVGTHNKIRVAYNNVYRKILGFCARDSASNMFVTNNINNMEALIRKQTYNFIERLSSSDNKLICQLNHCTTVLFGCIWNNWYKSLHVWIVMGMLFYCCTFYYCRCLCLSYYFISIW